MESTRNPGWLAINATSHVSYSLAEVGVFQQSPGWVHYMIHPPERHVLLFRRPLPKQPATATGGATATNGKVRLTYS